MTDVFGVTAVACKHEIFLYETLVVLDQLETRASDSDERIVDIERFKVLQTQLEDIHHIEFSRSCALVICAAYLCGQ